MTMPSLTWTFWGAGGHSAYCAVCALCSPLLHVSETSLHFEPKMNTQGAQGIGNLFQLVRFGFDGSSQFQNGSVSTSWFGSNAS